MNSHKGDSKILPSEEYEGYSDDENVLDEQEEKVRNERLTL